MKIFEKKESLLTSIIVVNLNNACCIEKCMDSIRRKTDPAYELIVIDNGSEDDSIHYLRSLESITLIQNKTNQGVSFARNQGLSIAKGEFIVLLDSDTVVTSRWLDRFIRCAEQNPNAGAIGPKSNCVSGPQCTIHKPYKNEAELDHFAEEWAATHRGCVTPIHRLIFFSIFLKRAVIEKIGGIDPELGKWGWGDDDFSVRAQLAGFDLLVADDVFIHHEESLPLNTSGFDCKQDHPDNWEFFSKKWHIYWQPGCASKETMESFITQPFIKEKHYISLPDAIKMTPLIFKKNIERENKDNQEGEKGWVQNIIRSREFLLNKAYKKAEQEAVAAIKSHYHMVEGHLALGEIAFAQNDFLKAKEIFQRAAGLNHEHLESHIRMGQILMKMDEVSDALHQFIHAIKIKPSSPEAHYGMALCYEKLFFFDKAIIACEKALSFIPDFWGITDWFKKYLLDGKGQLSFSSAFVASIYTTLAWCYHQTKESKNAALYIRSALDLDPEHSGALSVKEMIDSQDNHPHDVLSNLIAGLKVSASKGDDLCAQNLTLVVVTHFTEKLKKNRCYAPPTVGLVSKTYDSLKSVFGDSILNCRKFLWYDEPDNDNEKTKAYNENLIEFSKIHSFEYHRSRNAGLRKLMTIRVNDIATPYLLFVEHDWEFNGPPMELNPFIEIFDQYDEVNQIRFNQRANRIARFDFLMKYEKKITHLPLIQTIAASNNPSLFRVSTLKNKWIPIILNDSFFKKHPQEGTPFGVEEPLFKNHIRDVARIGFDKAHQIWGTYVYGCIGDSAFIKHIGE